MSESINGLPRVKRLEVYSKELLNTIKQIREASDVHEMNTNIGKTHRVLHIVKSDYPELTAKVLKTITKFWHKDASKNDVVNCLEIMRQQVCHDLEKEQT